MRVLHLLFAFAPCLALGVSGCGDDADAPSHPHEEIGCAADPRAQRYTPGISVEGARYRFVLEAADPAPPARGTNRWTVAVLDGDTPVTDITLGVAPFMPDHDHGPAELPVIVPTGDRFSVDAIDFFMPGLWRVTVSATQGAAVDSAEFHFCVAG